MKNGIVISENFTYQLNECFYKNYEFDFFGIDAIHEFEKLLKLDLSEYKNIIFILSDLLFDCIAKTSNPFEVKFHNNDDILKKDTFFLNFESFTKLFPTHTKFILLDNSPESASKSMERYVVDWLDFNINNYFISSRFYNITHKNSITDLTYLPLIFSFFEQNIDKYEKIEYSPPTNVKYNFITFLGHSEKPDKIEYRYDILKKLMGDKISQVKHEKDTETNKGLKYFKQPAFEGHIWNLLQSSMVKLQLIFETINPLQPFHNLYFFTEKTMKLFLLPHAYFLLVHGTALEKLESHGFRFSYKCFNFDDYFDVMQEILTDIDVWINKNQEDFYHNHENFYKIVNSNELPHHLFLKSLIE